MPHCDQAQCPICQISGRIRVIIPKFDEFDHGHNWCASCRCSFDSNVDQIRAIEIDHEMLSGLKDRKSYREIFVETNEIGNDSGSVYLDFQWADNREMQLGVARHIIDAIDKAGDMENPQILDVGCGNGFTTAILADRFGKENIIGLDPSPMIEQLLPRTGVLGISGTLDTVNFDDCQFDVVVILGNLMLHPDIAKTLAEVHRITKPGGIVIFDFKNIDCSSRRIARWIARTFPRLATRPALMRNFVNMRYGLARRHLWMIAPRGRFTLLDCYDKPPRLLEFSNFSPYQAGLKGAIWRLLNALDKLLHQQAWIQVALRKMA